MPDVKVRVEGGEELRRKLGDPQFVRGPLQTFLRKASAIVELHMKEEAPVDTGRLRSSVTSKIGQLSASIGPTVTYAPFVEYGTRPHWPPRGALQPWASRHGFGQGATGDRFVRFLISKRGTKAHPFVRPAAKRSLQEIDQAMRGILTDIKARWNGYAV